MLLGMICQSRWNFPSSQNIFNWEFVVERLVNQNQEVCMDWFQYKNVWCTKHNN